MIINKAMRRARAMRERRERRSPVFIIPPRPLSLAEQEAWHLSLQRLNFTYVLLPAGTTVQTP